jgi:hypothetical protein
MANRLGSLVHVAVVVPIGSDLLQATNLHNCKNQLRLSFVHRFYLFYMIIIVGGAAFVNFKFFRRCIGPIIITECPTFHHDPAPTLDYKSLVL